jgi:hypothetical protein
MGANVKNVECVTDFSDGRHFVRLHRDILMPAQACEAIRKLLAENSWEEAMSIALEHAPADAYEEIKLFFDSSGERLSSTGSAAQDSNAFYERVG